MARKVFTFAGALTVGAITVPGLKIGDQIVAIMDASGRDQSKASTGTQIFAQFVVVNGEILQTSAGLTDTYTALVERHVIF